MRLLCYLGQHEYQGLGEIFDLGCGNGGSTLALCHGLRHNTSPTASRRKVHALDCFEHGGEQHGGHASLEKFSSTTAGYEDRIVLHPVDIRTFDWRDTAPPIEILFVDVAKEIDLFEAVVKRFFGSFLPGRSILVHQDFGRPRLPWLHYSSMMLMPFMSILDVIEDSLVLRVESQPTTEVLARLVSPSLSPEQKANLVAEARRLFQGVETKGIDYADILALSEAYVWFYAGEIERVRDLLPQVRVTPSFEGLFGPMLKRLDSASRRTPDRKG
jgi:hypothetical protein